jgi:hypothetical protein
MSNSGFLSLALVIGLSGCSSQGVQSEAVEPQKQISAENIQGCWSVANKKHGAYVDAVQLCFGDEGVLTSTLFGSREGLGNTGAFTLSGNSLVLVDTNAKPKPEGGFWPSDGFLVNPEGNRESRCTVTSLTASYLAMSGCVYEDAWHLDCRELDESQRCRREEGSSPVVIRD